MLFFVPLLVSQEEDHGVYITGGIHDQELWTDEVHEVSAVLLVQDAVWTTEAEVGVEILM